MSEPVTVTVTHGETKEKVIFGIDLKGSLNEAVETFGEAVVFSLFCVGARIQARNKLASMVTGNNPIDAETALERMAEHRPFVASSRADKDPVTKVEDIFNNASDEERLRILEGLKAKIAEG